MFGSATLIQRCQVHKLRNIREHLPEGHRPWVRAIVARAYRQVEVASARRLL
jgi:transposase-like protein